MPLYLALGVLLAILLVQLGRWFVAANPHDLARGLRWAAFGLGGLLGLGLLVTERFGLLLTLGAMATPLFVSWRNRNPFSVQFNSEGTNRLT